MMQRRGFTLVELSIVLVIIGLLIGGILIGQNLIGSAQITAQIKQLQQFDIATNTFVTRFNFLPGDFSGNKDGWISGSGMNSSACIIGSQDGNDCSYMSCNPAAGNECQHFFADLSNVGGLAGSYDSTKDVSTYGFSKGAAYPASILGKGGVLVTQNHERQLFYLLIGQSAYILTGSPPRSVNPIDAQALDSKIDDGYANSGTVVIGFPNAWSDRPELYPLNSDYSGWGACNLSSNHATYDLTTDPNNPHCILQVKAM